MNDDAVRWALAQDTRTAGAKALLLVMAVNADAEGRVRIPQRDLAQMANVHPGTVSRLFGVLAGGGFVEFDRGNGGEVPVTYLRVGCT